jgi:hypothetical protein
MAWAVCWLGGLRGSSGRKRGEENERELHRGGSCGSYKFRLA